MSNRRVWEPECAWSVHRMQWRLKWVKGIYCWLFLNCTWLSLVVANFCWVTCWVWSFWNHLIYFELMNKITVSFSCQMGWGYISIFSFHENKLLPASTKFLIYSLQWRIPTFPVIFPLWKHPYNNTIFPMEHQMLITNKKYRSTNGLGTKCTISEQGVPKSFQVNGRQGKQKTMAEMESRKH